MQNDNGAHIFVLLDIKYVQGCLFVKKISIIPQIFPQLQKLQVHFNQGRRSVFDMGDDFMSCWGVFEGDVSPQKLENFVFFETRIMKFGEYFWVQN